MKKKSTAGLLILLLCGSMLLLCSPEAANSHCDSLDGPVISDARTALEMNDVTPVLKWIKQDREPEMKALFERTMKVRKLSPDAREIADMHFFETLVRIHREGEGFPYAGLKPKGFDPGVPVTEADQALESGSLQKLRGIINDSISHELQERFERAIEAKKHMNDSVEAGREYVEAYVIFVHFAERIYNDARPGGGHHSGEEEPEHEDSH